MLIMWFKKKEYHMPTISSGTYETSMNIYANMTKNMEEKASQKFSELMKGFVI